MTDDAKTDDATADDATTAEGENQEAAVTAATVAKANQRGIAALLARELVEDDRAEWTRLIAQREEKQEQDAKSLFIFRIGREWMALPTHRVQRVVQGAAPHTIPHRSETLLGLISVQGELVLCVSLSRLLKMETHREQQKAADGPGNYVVAMGEAGPVAFPVDESQGVHRYREADLREAPATVAEAAAPFTTAVLPWRQHSVGCLDDQLLFYAVDKSLS